MLKFLFAVPPFWGHINPTLSIGKTLLERGHQVAWAGMTYLNPDLLPNGGQYFHLTNSEEQNKDEINRIIELQNEGANMPALEALKLGLQETYIPFAKMMMEEYNEVVDIYKPDVIINDCITLAGSLSAHLKGIPCATLTPITPNALNNPQTAPKVTEWIHGLVSELQRSVGIEEEGEFIQSQQLNMYYTSQKFAGYDDDMIPPYMKFIGALTGRPDNTPFDWDKLKASENPIIYISIGTVLVNSRREFFERMTEALKDKPVTVVAAADPKIMDKWPENFIVQGYVPQSELLKHVDVVVGHGGLNTVCDTFINGIPMLIVPMAFDQSHTAQLIENYGCGIRIKYSRMRIKDIEQAIDELLFNPKYKKAAEEIQESFIDAGGNERAADLLEDLAAKRP